MRWLMVALCVGLFVLPAYAADPIAENVAKLGVAKEQFVKIGEQVYNTEGENTCLQCHGKGGTGGTQAGAADLRHPKTWRVYQYLGGDEAIKANKEKFLKDMETALHDLIRNGSTQWNQRFPSQHKDIAMDWGKVSIPDKADKYNQMMKGITSEPMKKKIRTWRLFLTSSMSKPLTMAARMAGYLNREATPGEGVGGQALEGRVDARRGNVQEDLCACR